jgi:ketosteroid isomerase-like protein
MTALDEFRALYHQSVEAFIRGDPEPQKGLWSHRDDVTLANPLGPPVKGWDNVSVMLDRAASQVLDGRVLVTERISGLEAADLAYDVEIERVELVPVDTPERVRVALRVTTVFRREEEDWRIVHRHADPITGARPIQSVVQTG